MAKRNPHAKRRAPFRQSPTSPIRPAGPGNVAGGKTNPGVQKGAASSTPTGRHGR